MARLANLLGGGVLVQHLGDLQEGRRTTPERLARGIVEPTLASATPGDLSFTLPLFKGDYVDAGGYGPAVP